MSRFIRIITEINQMIIVPVSDLHADVLIVTGDLTNAGLVKEYEKSKLLLSQIKTKNL